MVNNNVKLLDKIHIQKYIYLLNLFVTNQIDTTIFEYHFLKIRREDNYWLEGQFCDQISRILDSFFLCVDEYNPDSLFDPEDKFNINETYLKNRSNDVLVELKSM